ncbi:MAG: putative serine threonine-protein kinase nek2 [Streblomastix strix]|uniref:non-specific serine/threonine protein kinase n=1 Tax=Streblomastix strix TaxID=222440 RepID=A0A5J4W851_9EUKA|nr:MAG: putative serine threonine-protein kinase nek2 [Streblomastix strix]
MPKFSDYDIIRALGRGAFGTTFLVNEIATGKECVWKKMAITNDEDRRMAQSEVDMLQHVRGEFLVSFLGSFENQHEFFILTEYCDQGDLRKYMNSLKENGQQISEDKVWDILTQMVQALHSLHEMDIIHRDLKPENVFLTGPLQVKLGDFGLARIAYSTQYGYTHVGGTQIYFAPELLDDEDDDSGSGSDEDPNNLNYKPLNLVVQTKETDIFAVGEICYELITLKHPFASKKGKITNKRIKKCIPKSLPSHISESQRQVIMLMLNKDPIRRPTTGQLLTHPEINIFII